MAKKKGKSAQGQEQDSKANAEPASTSAGEKKLALVGIGASAGGLAALKALFSDVPSDSGIAFVVVVHLSPDHKSHLAELLQPHVRMPVRQVTETVAMEADHVYVIPPNANLESVDTHLRLTELEERRQERAPIDHFFRTLARTHDGDAVGVILTGTGSDGTLGMREIKARGGVIVVQDPNDAEYDGMPQSAIATGIVDLVLPLREIPEALVRLVRTKPLIRVPSEGEEPEAETRRLLQKVFGLLRSRTGRDFSQYKRSTIIRRIARRMQFRHITEFSQYTEFLATDTEETRLLADDLLITVTNFFRDAEVFATLEKRVIPGLFEGKAVEEPIRIWIVGCATGEEAYSIAILLLEEAARRNTPHPIQIFASDLHEHSLGKARDGFYPGDVETDVSPSRLNRFFKKEEGGYRVRKEVRETVVFAPHNLLSDPPFSRLDMIACRNLLIYLQREVQRDVIDLFHYALVPDGVLLLGTSESLESPELFRTFDKKCCLYRKRNVPAPEPRLPVFPLTRIQLAHELHRHERESEPLPYALLHQQMVERVAPPSVLVSPDDRVAHFSGRAGRYLVHPGGEPTTNIFKLVREELRIELRSVLAAARERRRPSRSSSIPVRFNGESSDVTLSIYPALDARHEGFALILFEEENVAPSEMSGTAPLNLEQGNGDQESDSVRSELVLARQRLQVIIEEYETGQEELKASNEELQSANEELRSTLEELETSKEELQSMNEELQTVNQENRHKVEELDQLSSDLQNLLAATEIATLFLDRELRILRFTPKVAELFNVRMTDRGRSLSDFTNRLGYDQLQDDARQVLKRLVPIEREMQDDAGRWYLIRVLPYRSSEDRIDGVVATFFEITERKKAEVALRENEERYRLLVESATEYAILMLDRDGKITTWNRGAERIFGYGENQALGRSGAMLFTQEDRQAGAPEEEMRLATRDGRASDERWQQRKDGTRFWANGVMEALYDDRETADVPPPRGFVKVLRDNTERKQLETDLRQLAGDLAESNRLKDDFLATLAHELRNPLAPIRSGLDLLKTGGDDPELLQKVCSTMERQTTQLITLVDDLLDISRITRAKLELRLQRVALGEIVESAVESAHPLLAERSHELKVEIPDEPILLDADPHRLAQVLSNLLGNAAKYTPEKGKIRLAAQRSEEEVLITVQDSGIGIPKDMLGQIFQMFAQVDRPQERGYTGLGIGLTLVKSLVEMHGGTIHAESEGTGCGSRFWIRLPVAAGPEPTAEGSSQPPLELSRSAVVQRVLVVDDNDSAASLLQMLIQRCGHEVRVAQDGRKAIEVAREFLPSVILMDLGMPEMNGYEAARLIRQEPWGKGIKLVALTGWGKDEDRRRTHEAGFDEHLVKPAKSEDLLRILSRIDGP